MRYLIYLFCALVLSVNAYAKNIPNKAQPTKTEALKNQAELDKQDINPEAFTGMYSKPLVTAKRYMVSSANEFASQAGANMLNKGASAVDAAITMQLVLNLVEPQSSGIGGGGFMLTYNSKDNQITAWDGRETAPQAVSSTQFLQNGKPMPFFEAVNSGLSVGTPGLVQMLFEAHQQEGRLDWASLFEPAIHLAETGFPVSERLHSLLVSNESLKNNPSSATYFYDAQGQALEVGHILKNKALAQVFKKIAKHGPSAFYKGQLAQDMVNAVVNNHPLAGSLSLEDLASYQVKQRQPLCTSYKVYTLCGAPPPSSGPIAVMQILGMLEHTPISKLEPNSLLSVHYFSEAGRLAYADRDQYIADPDFINVPTQQLLNKKYLQERAKLIRPDQSMGVARAGRPFDFNNKNGHDNTQEAGATTHLTVIDEQGNVVSMTTSIESAFGSKIFVNGYLLNNELTDFSFTTEDEYGNLIANRIEPLKRPRSSMAPMIILKNGKPIMAIGSPGGSAIINYVAKAVLGVLDWNLPIQSAIDLPNRGSRNRYTELEARSMLTGLKEDLIRMKHNTLELDFPSGLHGFVIKPEGIEGGADPRREGRAMGK